MIYESEQVMKMCQPLTYRQLDYWTTKEWIKPDASHPGSGYERRWTFGETVIINIGLRLISIGFRPEPALALARLLRTAQNPIIYSFDGGLDVKIGVISG